MPAPNLLICTHHNPSGRLLVFGPGGGLLGGFLILLGDMLVGGLGEGPLLGPLFGLLIGLLGGVILGLEYGGYACLSHIALRLVLWQNSAMPLPYVRFLDENAQRILLHKVGGGYIFIHRLLLDYFAKQHTGPETAEVNATRKST